jgi:hypothetical protein
VWSVEWAWAAGALGTAATREFVERVCAATAERLADNQLAECRKGRLSEEATTRPSMVTSTIFFRSKRRARGLGTKTVGSPLAGCCEW